MEALAEEIDEQLRALGAELSPDELLACARSCSRCRLGAEPFAESWAAFRLSRGEALRPVTDALLERFERTLAEAEAEAATTAPSRRTSNYENAPMAEYLPMDMQINSASEYDNSQAIGDKGTSGFHPDTYSALTQSTKYSLRTNSGDIVCTFGDESKSEKSIWNNMSNDSCNVAQVLNNSNTKLTSKAMYGFELLQNKASFLDNNIKYLSQCVKSKNNIKESVPVKCKSQVPVSIVGRVDCDSSGRLNSKSVILQGTWEESLGHKIPIDLDQLRQYSLFPGQVVAMTGLNMQGDKFIAHEVFSDGSLPKPKPIILDSSITEPLHVVLACGPFTTSDSLTYDPLNDYINYISQNKPHVAIFVGPFLDANHQSVVENVIAETFKVFFEKLVEKIMNAVNSTSAHTQVVFVSSPKDAFHTCVYPSPPYQIRKTYPNIIFASDPCVLNIGGVDVGITSTDILMHLSREEISLPQQGPDKLGRLASHLLQQQNFYPLWPPAHGLSLDVTLWSEHCDIITAPHVLVVPSDFRYFAKEINGTVVVNPERLTKGVGAGMFARMQISSSESRPSDNIICQVVRI